MERKFLEALKIEGLTKEIIDSVMDEHGKGIELKKTEIKTLKADSEVLKTQMSDTNTKLKEFEGMDIEGVKKALTDLQDKHEKDTADFKQQKETQSYNHAVDNYFNDVKFSSDFAKDGVKAQFLSKEFKFEDGKFLGADDYIKGLKESAPTTFLKEEGNQQQGFGEGFNNGSGGDSTTAIEPSKHFGAMFK